MYEAQLAEAIALFALGEWGCQRHLVDGLRLLVLVANDGWGHRTASCLHVAHAAPALLLVLDREPDLPAGRAEIGRAHV